MRTALAAAAIVGALFTGTYLATEGACDSPSACTERLTP